MDPLGEELLRTQREVQVGKTRREALRNMATRAMHPDISAWSARWCRRTNSG
jgi:Flp pilus assembly protein TadB